MSRSAKAEATLALNRFGMGPRPGSIAAIEADPRGALIAELERPPAALAAAQRVDILAQHLLAAGQRGEAPRRLLHTNAQRG